MTIPPISESAKVYLLLTSRLSVGQNPSSCFSIPLDLKELDGLAQRLNDLGGCILDLVSASADDLVHELGDGWDSSRLRGLLGRGMKMSLAIENWSQRGIWVLCREDEDYPRLFRERMGPSAPPIIYGCGDTDLLDAEGVAIVGSRRADNEILKFARTAGRQSADAGFSVVSGGAKGVDQAAMAGAIDGDGSTIAVLANGLKSSAIASENRILIADDRLLLISPFDPSAGFSVGNAMGRNKLIFALSRAGLVVESDYNRGGTWAGAVEQLGKLNYAPIYVRSTGRQSDGLEALKRKGALEWADTDKSETVEAFFENLRNPTESIAPAGAHPAPSIDGAKQAALLYLPLDDPRGN